MNSLYAIKLATLCGVLAQPGAMAETFIQPPAPMVFCSNADEKMHEQLARFIEQVNIGKAMLVDFTENAESMYFDLIEMNTDKARAALTPSHVEHCRASEMFMRGFEIEINAVAEMEGMPEFIVSEIKAYGRNIAKARSVITRFNRYVKQLTQQPDTFESSINFDALKELASYTTKNLLDKQLH